MPTLNILLVTTLNISFLCLKAKKEKEEIYYFNFTASVSKRGNSKMLTR